MHRTPLEDILELARLERTHWPAVSARITGPRCEGDGGDGGTGGAGGTGDGGTGTGTGGGTGDGGTGAAGGTDDWTPPTREEYDAMIAERDQAKAAAARSSRAARENDRKGKTQAGQFEELYTEEKQRAEKLMTGLSTRAIKATVTEIAQRMHFRNPTLAARLIDIDGLNAQVDEETYEVEVGADVKTIIERRLTAAANADGYLLTTPPQRQLPGAGAGNGDAAAAGNAAMNAAIRRAAGRG